mmetsp:Transcript_22981/g.70356  ORF Transcript_22981/g.70356 Transcript_22981/m.70356 type:complete len:311 (+) Transcript_22981:3450-4382(+)
MSSAAVCGPAGDSASTCSRGSSSSRLSNSLQPPPCAVRELSACGCSGACGSSSIAAGAVSTGQASIWLQPPALAVPASTAPVASRSPRTTSCSTSLGACGDSSGHSSISPQSPSAARGVTSWSASEEPPSLPLCAAGAHSVCSRAEGSGGARVAGGGSSGHSSSIPPHPSASSSPEGTSASPAACEGRGEGARAPTACEEASGEERGREEGGEEREGERREGACPRCSPFPGVSRATGEGVREPSSSSSSSCLGWGSPSSAPAGHSPVAPHSAPPSAMRGREGEREREVGGERESSGKRGGRMRWLDRAM